MDGYFTNDPEDMKFLLFFLGFFLGDGCNQWVYCEEPGRVKIKLQALTIGARDRSILDLFAKKLQNTGCITKLTYISSVNNYSLYIKANDVLVRLLLRGFKFARQLSIPLDGKLNLLWELLLAFPLGVSDGLLSTKTKSFKQFLGEELIHDDVDRVVAQ
jgi:hypothetical protein